VRYGYAMRLNRITKMTTSEYEETPVQTIAPTKGGLRGTHTFAYVPGLTMLDALRTRFAV